MEYLFLMVMLVWLVECTSGEMVFTKTDLAVLKSFDGRGCPGDAREPLDKRYYRYLQKSDKNSNVLYVGAMNNLYKLQLSDMSCLNYNESIPHNETMRKCDIQGKSYDVECQNHFRLVMEMGNHLLVCGTGGYYPKGYTLNDNLQINSTFEGAAYCPYDPWDNYTALLSSYGNPGNATVPYFATFADFIKNKPVISRPKFEGLDGVSYSSKKTDDEDISWLNAPQFVGSFEDEEKVMFFFREKAVEVETTDNEDVIYSRVGKVCKQDLGGGYMGVKKTKWLSFQKTRLLCSGFDDIYDVYQTGDQFYALFYRESFDFEYGVLPTSAICVYNKEDIEASFAGKFQYRPGKDKWQTLPDNLNPNPRLDNCTTHRDSPGSFANIVHVTNYHLMAQSVQPVYGKPIYHKAGVQFINIAVSETKVSGQTTGKNIYLASDEGEIYNLFMKTDPAHTSTFMLEKNPTVYRPFGLDKDRENAIWDMKLLHQSTLVLGTDYEVAKLNVKDLCEHTEQINVCILNTMCKWSKCYDGSCVKADAPASCSSLDWTNIVTDDAILSIKDEITESDEDISAISAVEGLYVTLPFKTKIFSDSVVWLKSSNCSGIDVLRNPEKFAISSSKDLTVKNLTVEVDNDTKYSVCYKSSEKIKLKGYGITVATDTDQIVKVWKQQFNEWSSAFVKWKGCANSYYDSCGANDGG